MEQKKPLLIGLSARLIHQTPDGFEIKGRTIQYLEQNIAHIIAKHGALVFMIPSLESSSVLESSDLDALEYAQALDGLVLQGGVDISPLTYGEEPVEVMKDHRVDLVRDRYELKLLRAFSALNKPVLGICRGFQLMNVFKGGSLFQDLPSQLDSNLIHGSALYDKQTHAVSIEPGGIFEELYSASGDIVSIHHQGVKKLGHGLKIEAKSEDGLVEAFSSTEDHFFVGVQWHPEFHDREDPKFLSAAPLVLKFLTACMAQKEMPNAVKKEVEEKISSSIG